MTSLLTVKMHPRVRVSSEDLEQQFQLATELSAMLSASSEAVLQAKSLRAQLKSLSSQPTGSLTGSLKEAISQLDTKLQQLAHGPDKPPAGASPPPALGSINDDTATLYGLVNGSDVAPTPAMITATRKVAGHFNFVIRAWAPVKQ